MAPPLLGTPQRTRPGLGLHAGLLLATLASTGLTYFAMWGGQQEAAFALLGALLPGGASPAQAWAELSAQVPLGEMVREAAVFALSLCGVLGAHEMGHYVLARRHGVDTSLPYFLPLPLLGTGTLGAVIRLRGRIPSRNALVDIGAAGPLAGLVVALPLLGWGLLHSRVVPAVVSGGAGAGWPGPSSLWALGAELLAHLLGRAPEAGADSGLALVMFADNLFMVGVERLVLGARAAGTDLVMHPTVLAAWFGLFVTLLNLLPLGQLDGGHVAYAVLGRRARPLGQAVAVALALLTLFGTWMWLPWFLVVTKLIGFGHPPVSAPEERLSPGRWVVSALCLVALAGCMMPVPFRVEPL